MSGAVPLLLHTSSRSAGTALATAVEGTVQCSLFHCFVVEQVSSSFTASLFDSSSVGISAGLPAILTESLYGFLRCLPSKSFRFHPEDGDNVYF